MRVYMSIMQSLRISLTIYWNSSCGFTGIYNKRISYYNDGVHLMGRYDSLIIMDKKAHFLSFLLCDLKLKPLIRHAFLLDRPRGIPGFIWKFS